MTPEFLALKISKFDELRTSFYKSILKDTQVVTDDGVSITVSHCSASGYTDIHSSLSFSTKLKPGCMQSTLQVNLMTSSSGKTSAILSVLSSDKTSCSLSRGGEECLISQISACLPENRLPCNVGEAERMMAGTEMRQKLLTRIQITNQRRSVRGRGGTEQQNRGVGHGSASVIINTPQRLSFVVVRFCNWQQFANVRRRSSFDAVVLGACCAFL
ncbi:hypothetical protein LSTR_LSTR010598 [Laodelphax striatellus]|uniref:Uncharacterized protein n=1 Tax=Laodelphax striatellus TaxID=195883 RepID=A0A482XJ05_LAOST|nr:hypothetical protein LSTR_LSTR010598 [Laodelphax striatellus]